MGAAAARPFACPRCNDLQVVCADREEIEEEDFSEDCWEQDRALVTPNLIKSLRVLTAEDPNSPSKSSRGKSKCLAAGSEQPLRSHFLSEAYLLGHDLDASGSGYILEPFEPGAVCPVYRHPSLGCVVSTQALHLAPCGSPDLDVVFHYTTEHAFNKVCSSAKVSKEQWNALKLEGLLCGKQVCTLSVEPKEVAAMPVVADLWPDHAMFCLPLVLPRAWLLPDSCLRSKASILRGFKQFGDLGVCTVRCPDLQGALACASACGLQRRRAAVENCRLELGAQDPRTLSAVACLALASERQGEAGEAERYYREALRGYQEHCGASHPAALAILCSLGRLLESQGQLELAEPYHRRAFECYEAQLGSFHAHTISACNQLATVMVAQGKHSEAEALLRRALEQREDGLGAQHPETLFCVCTLADLLEAEGRLQEAEAFHRRVLQWRGTTLGEAHEDSLLALGRLARLLKAQGKLEEAEIYFRRALQLTREQHGPWHPSTFLREDSLASVLVSQGELDMAASTYRELLEGKEALLGREHAETLATAGALAELLEAQDELEQAEKLYSRVCIGCEAKLGSDHPASLASAQSLARVTEKSKSRMAPADDAEALGKPEDFGPLACHVLQARLVAFGAGRPEAALIAGKIVRPLGAQGPEFVLGSAGPAQHWELPGDALKGAP